MQLTYFRRLSLTALVVVIASPLAGAESLQPSGWAAGVAPKEAIDINPDPGIVEINMSARIAPVDIAEGTRVEAWTYDGGLPGPLIRAKVGDRLIVHFSNALPKPTTV